MVPIIKSSDYQDTLNKLYGFTLDNIKNITFQVTDRCSLKCSYCYQINKGKRKMSFETAKKAIDLIFSDDPSIRDYLGNDVKAYIIEFIGGEPTLEPELMDQVVNYFREVAFKKDPMIVARSRISIASNGMHYFEPAVNKFLMKNANSLSFSISLDGNKELHDSCRRFPDGSPSFDKAIAAIHDWRAHGNEMGSKITLCPANIDKCFEASKFMVEEGYNIIHINFVYEEGWSIDDAKVCYEQLKKFADYMLELDAPQNIFYALFDYDKYTPQNEAEDKNWCGGDGNMLAIDPDGRLFPCIRYMESALGTEVEPICIGDVDNGIGKCAKCQKCIKMLEGVTRSVCCEGTDCLDCPVSTGCGWCSGYNYQRYGTLKKRTTFQCWLHKAASLANVYYLNKLNRKFNDSYRVKMYLPKEDALQIISEDEYNMLVDLTKEE